jgi:DNA polymerase III epsilon subunit family exonuclease
MAKKSAIRVALDLETTGLHPEQDAILEIAAVKFQGSEIIDTFETFVASGRSIPYRIQRLTGITAEHLVGAPHFSVIAKKLSSFLEDYPIVGHSIPFDVSFLRLRGLARTNPLIDTFELATVLLPSLTSYNLGQVAEALGLHVPHDRHRAMVDTVLAMQVFVALHQRLSAIDLSLLNDLAHLDAPRSWPLLHFFRQELHERQVHDGLRGTLSRGSLGDRFASQLGMDPRVLSFAISPATNNISPVPQGTAVDFPASVVRGEDAHGVKSPRLTEMSESKGYQQACLSVKQALEQRTPLLLEVAVEGYDYTPVLLPALEWLKEGAVEARAEASPAPTAPAQEQGASLRRMVVACTTQQQARRLMETVLPKLQAFLESHFSVAYLAEHSGYLCTHRWFGAALRRTSGELSAEQARGLAKLGLWANQTESGERSEITLLPQELGAWDRISSGVERVPSGDARFGTSYQRCNYRRKGYCFVSRAEERVNAAQIVVTTHTALFDDLALQHSLLAPITARIVLDADMLEEENARWSSYEINQGLLLGILNTIGTELSDGRYQGLLALAAPSLRDNGPGGLSSTPTIVKSEMDSRTLSWFQCIRQARVVVEKLFTSFRVLQEESQMGANGKGRSDTGGRSSSGYHNRNNERSDQALRLNGHIRQMGVWGEVEQAWQQVAQRLQAVIDLAYDAEKRILTGQRQRNRLELGSGEDISVASELAVAANQLVEYKQRLQQALSLAESDRVYWLRMPPVPSSFGSPALKQTEQVKDVPDVTPVLHSQIVRAAPLLKRTLLTEQCSTIFVGSALSVDNSFAFIRGRFGLDIDVCPEFSMVQEHHEQTLLYVPNDVPEPNAPQYQRHLEEALVQLATSLEGQVVALFTSHASLRSSYATIKPLLETRGILVLAQGMDGSPRQLWQVYRSQERVVLLGTGSFWEGQDELISPPTCLFIARLPMPVLNDPPIAARAEQYSDQLHNLTVPMASLRVRRTLNRLVWKSEQRNAVVLFDRRVISKEYGSMVLHSLPRCSQRHGTASHMPETVLDWLTATGSWEDNAV